MTTATKEKPAKAAALKVTPTKASTSVAVRPTKNTNIVSITEALKKQAEDMSGRVLPPGGSKIRATQDKKFILPDGTTTPGPLELVVLDFRTVHNFYESAYDQKSIVAPGCFSVGLDPKNMVPSADSPNKQADSCNECPMHEWGSDGDGKACKEGRLLAVLPPDATEDTPIWLLQSSPTANKGFDAYVTSVKRAFQMPPIAVVTTVSFDDSTKFAKMVFGDPQPNKALAAMFGRQAEAGEILDAARDVSSYQAPAKAGAKAAVRKPAGKR